MKEHNVLRRVFAAFLSLCMALGMAAGVLPTAAFAAPGTSAAAAGPTVSIETGKRQADPSTMDTYRTVLDLSSDTRSAGQLWSDKTVFAYGQPYDSSDYDKDPSDNVYDDGTPERGARIFDGKTLTLTHALDGLMTDAGGPAENESIELDADFLHIYSVLGSSEELDEPVPADLVLALDISGSMGSPIQNESSGWVNTVDPDAGDAEKAHALGYYQNNGGGSTPADDDNGIPDAIAPVLPSDMNFSEFNSSSGQMKATSLTSYNAYLEACNALVNAIKDADTSDTGTISETEASAITAKVAEFDAYIPAGSQTQESYQTIYTAYLAYKDKIDKVAGGKNAWLSDAAEGRNAAWPDQGWMEAWDTAKFTGSSEGDNPLLNAPQAPNRLYYVLQAANDFIDRYLALNTKNRISVVVYDSVATVLMPLARYQKAEGEDFLSAEKHHWQNWGKGQWACTVTATAKLAGGYEEAEKGKLFPAGTLDGNTYTASVTSWSNTDTQAAINAGLDILAQSYDSYGDMQQRVPLMVLMTDGAANAVLTGVNSAGSLTSGGTLEKAWTKGATKSTDLDGAARFNSTDGMVMEGTYNALTTGSREFVDKTTNGLTAYGAGAGHIYGSETHMPTRYTVVLNTLMSAAYQKTRVEKHYNNAGGDDKGVEYPKDDEAAQADWTKALIYTIGFGLEAYSGDDIQNICAEILDPAKTFEPTNEGKVGDNKSQQAMYHAYNEWYNKNSYDSTEDRKLTIEGEMNAEGEPDGNKNGTVTVFKPSATNSSIDGNPNQLTELKLPLKGNDLVGDPNGVTKEDIARNIGYNANYYTAKLTGDGTENNETLGDVFEDILAIIQGEIFRPIGGQNDMGVQDAITYSDPIGQYMEVKDVKNMLLFGKLHGVTKTAVYNWQFNDDYVNNHGLTNQPFPGGWYMGEDGATATPYSSIDPTPNAVPEGDADAAWAAGWVYHVSSATASQFVPTLGNIITGSPDAKVKATTYTFYRLEDAQPDRDALHMNPAYGTDDQITQATRDATDEASPDYYTNVPGVYKLSDLRIWVEDSGDYNDTTTSDIDTNYSEALYVNLPVNMLPLRKVSIEAEADGSYTYKTNLEDDSEGHAASFPMRVFYTVGIEDERLTADGSLDVAGLQAEYVSANKVDSAVAQAARGYDLNDIEFFSNWYNPELRYNAYATSNTDYSYGNPMVSFSPSSANRYYLFQKALPLYSTAYIWSKTDNREEDAWRNVKVVDSGDTSSGDESVRTITASDFGGKIIAIDLKPAELAEGDDLNGAIQAKMWAALNAEHIYQTQAEVEEAKASGHEDAVAVSEGDIVLLEKHRLSDVEKKAGSEDPFSSEGYYFLPIDYYEYDETGNTAHMVQYAVARKGSEFGSGYASAGIKNGDMLCWHDLNGMYGDYPYLSASETGDMTRGKQYIGAELDSDGKYKNDPDGDGKPNDPDLTTKNSTYLSSGQWVVCAKPGGLRVGNMAQSVREKTFGVNGDTYTTYDRYREEKYPDNDALTIGYYNGNTTRTANNYYLPTIGRNSTLTEAGVAVDIYLGNNGRLAVPSTTLLVTKRLLHTAAAPSDEANRGFDFQVSIADAANAQDAIVVRYNDTAKTWQRQLHFIDLSLGTGLFLQDSAGTVTQVARDGRRLTTNGDDIVYADGSGPYNAVTDGGPYYVYIGTNVTALEGVGQNTFRVFHNTLCEQSDGSVGRQDVIIYNEGGKQTFKATNVWLFTGEQYRQFLEERSGGNYQKDDGSGAPNWDDVVTLQNFTLLTFDPASASATEDSSSEVQLSSDYKTQSEYLTKTIYFGYKDADAVAKWLAGNEGKTLGDVPPEYALTDADLFDTTTQGSLTPAVANTAGVKLQHGCGLLFVGLPSGTDYRLTERLPKDDVDGGYSFYNVVHIQQDSTETRNAQTAAVAGKAYTYSVSGDTGTNEEAGHFRNIWNTDKSETEINGETIDQTTDPLKPGVQVGDTITYKIDWRNTAGEPAAVAVIDPLDPGVDFVSASAELDGEPLTLAAGTDGATTSTGDTVEMPVYDENGVPTESTEQKPCIVYSGAAGGHTVTWNLGKQAADAHGSVTLTVRVNASAPEYWDYDITAPSPEETDYLVRDRATVRVAGNTYYTQTVKNPTGRPEKTETQINEGPTLDDSDFTTRTEGDDTVLTGPLVYPGDVIHYSITWRNGENAPAAVTVRDPLDENVEFVSAAYHSKNRTDSAGEPYTAAGDPVDIEITAEDNGDPAKVPDIYYDADEHEVVWKLGEQPVGVGGTVELVVQVLPGATQAGKVDNQAGVTVGTKPEQKTNIIENPTPDTHKTETAPGDGERVQVGGTVSYEINWDSRSETEAEPDSKIEKVTVTDPLDPGVDFASASYGGVTLNAAAGSEAKNAAGTIAIAYDSATHTVTWTLTGDAAVPTGKVQLQVLVTARALAGNRTLTTTTNPDTNAGDWDYRNGTGLEADGGQLVQNRAAVKFNDDHDIATELVKNPLTPDKEEVAPGDRVMVGVGEEITYRIYWQNYEPTAAKVVVIDPLDPGVDLVSATYDGTTLNADAESWKPAKTPNQVTVPQDGDPTQNETVPVIAYSGFATDGREYTGDGCHTVTWNLGVMEPNQAGYVELVVRVNGAAFESYGYATGDYLEPVPGGESDYEVLDRAGVKVGNNGTIYTRTVENPVPEKTETAIQRGEASVPLEHHVDETDGSKDIFNDVYPGDIITYTISWRNANDEPADVTVTDVLDLGKARPGVDFVSASVEDAGVTLNAPASDDITSEANTDKSIVITYDPAQYKVTWTLAKVPAGQVGTVTLKVKVNDNATEASLVDNQASVQVGSGPVVTTRIQENPTPKIEKIETAPGEGMQVMPGDPIDYEITWRNYETDPETSTVIIRDKLDPGVNFAGASIAGSDIKLADGTSGNAADSVELAAASGAALSAPIIASLADGEEQDNAPEQPDGEPGADTPAADEGVAPPQGEATEPPQDGPAQDEGTEPPQADGTAAPAPQASAAPAEDAANGDEATPTPTAEQEPAKTINISNPVAALVNGIGQALRTTALGAGPEVAGTTPETTAEPETAPEGQPAPEPTQEPTAAPEPTEAPAATAEPTAEPTQAPVPEPTATPGPAAPTAAPETELPQGTAPAEDDAPETDGMLLGDPDSGLMTTGLEPSVTAVPAVEGDITVDGHTIHVKIEYLHEDSDGLKGHQVVWTLTGVPALAEGKVHLSVLVNDTASELQDYNDAATDMEGTADAKDDRVRNQARVQVNNDAEVLTRKIENPTKPNKTETAAGDNTDLRPEDFTVEAAAKPNYDGTGDGASVNRGPKVRVGDRITYNITWQNNAADAESNAPREANILITDPLDPGVTFLSASYRDVTLEGSGSKAGTVDGIPVSILYDAASHTVIWDLGQQTAQATGTVQLVVEVNADALTVDAGDTEGDVENQAKVEVDHAPQYTDWIRNPLDGDGGLLVSKTVTGTAGDTSKPFHFTVTLSGSGAGITGRYGDMDFADGVAEFTLKHNESKRATDLPAGATYTVVEAEADKDGYTTKADGATGTIPKGGLAEASFVNSKDAPPPPPTTPTPPPPPPPTIPKTSDDSNPALWVALLAASLAALLATAWLYRRRRKNDPEK